METPEQAEVRVRLRYAGMTNPDGTPLSEKSVDVLTQQAMRSWHRNVGASQEREARLKGLGKLSRRERPSSAKPDQSQRTEA